MIVYATRTGNVKYICKQLEIPHQTIHEPINEPFVLFTYTDGIGQVPLEVKEFMQDNHALCKGILVSGQSNFGPHFGAAGNKLSREYRVPLGVKLDLRGTTSDYEDARAFYGKVIRN